MASSNIAVAGFVRERVPDIEHVTASICFERNNNSKTQAKKRDFCSVFYRPRSFRSYKMPRLEKKMGGGTNRKVKQLLESIQKKKKRGILYRAQRRRLSAAGSPLLSPSSSLSDLLAQAPIKLPTHIYHRKRLHMDIEDGFYIANGGCGRGLKSIDKLCKKGTVLVQDQSFLRPILVAGPTSSLVMLFSVLNDPASDLLDTLQNMTVRTVAREVRVMIHQPHCFPNEAVGPVVATVTVDHAVKGGDLHAKVLLWPHPAILLATMTVLSDVAAELPECAVELFRRPLGRLMVWGSRASTVLSSVLDLPRDADALDAAHFRFFAGSLASPTTLRNVWRPNELLSLTAALVSVPQPPSDCPEHAEGEPHPKLRWPTKAAASPLWTQTPPCDFSSAAKRTKEIERNLLKRQQLEGAWEAWEKAWDSVEQISAAAMVRQQFPVTEEPEQRVSMLIAHQRPTKSNPTLLDRATPAALVFHFILPCEEVQRVMIALIRRRCAAIGSSEMHHLQTRSGLLSFPQDFLDCRAGWAHWESRMRRAACGRLLRPRSKRQLPAYRRHGHTAQFLGFALIKRWLYEHAALYGGGEDGSMALEEDVDVDVDVDVNEAASEGGIESSEVDGVEVAITGDDTTTNVDAVAGESDDQDAEADPPHFVVIRNETYLSAFLPTASGASALPALPQLTMLHVQLRPFSRGLPRTCALIISALEGDADALNRLFTSKRVGGKSPLQSAYAKRPADQWSAAPISAETMTRLIAMAAGGCADGDAESAQLFDGRRVLGFVSSGAAPHTNHTNKLHLGGEEDGFLTVGMAHASLLHDYLAQPSLLDGRRVNDVVFFWNYGSHWLRPALVKFL